MSSIRQLVIASRDYNGAVSEICAAFGSFVTFVDPELNSLGLRNALIPIGDSFFEVVSPIIEGTTAERYINKFGEGQVGREATGYMIEMQVSDIVDVEKRMTNVGARILMRPGRDAEDKSKPYEVTGDLNVPGLSGIHWHPKDIGVIMETAEHHPPEDWLYAGRAWKTDIRERMKVGLGFAGVTVAVNGDPIEMAMKWSRGLGRPIASSEPSTVILEDGGRVKFRRRRNEKEDGLVEVDVYSANSKETGREFRMCGILVRLVPKMGPSL
mmetsp:Transcript_12923/g.15667  ORF Transcript_12923/g.15667 Transcript_12923/m.15667 type:complete len:269 (+) Transcript_12923:123-929(+)|eukprot:CAMPEP_0184027348 /NCGR_PEP_ID=MMETSP0954-20121128/14135_1 /TAXON_ID=627963 /ORGANISM="Aplanochytrium sp, Strain PBS07" /LENGTH=268 /DNA_ID=CAMNT_0026311871 /DNA_START=53 /DNA_END=859 /DNA_ORIENTATION=-